MRVTDWIPIAGPEARDTAMRSGSSHGRAKGEHSFIVCRIGKTRKKKAGKPVIDLLPELLVNALARGDGFIVTFENDPENPPQKLHVMTGKFITGCMLRKLQGQAESQRDEGSTLLTGEWG
jgi:hypothetical protein